jgi:hypothetical protein
MKNTDFTQQILDWNKTTVDSAVNLMERFQEHGEKVVGSYVELSPWGTEEGKKALGQWNDYWKQSFKSFKESLAFGFKQAEGLCTVAKKTK